MIYSMKVAQDYKDCYFKLEQITSGCYQSYTLTLESGLFNYPYEHKDVEPVKSKITIKF